MITLDSVTKRYSTALIVQDISFSLEGGKSLSIIGPSGCGKTTILYMIAGLIHPSTGRILLNRNEITRPDYRTAFILQDYGLLPWKTVFQNVSLGMKIKKVPEADIRPVVEKILSELGIISHRDKYPANLSGGEKQRVAIARALATGPELLLMDEPFSSLDTLTREKLQQTIYDIHKQSALTLITVTHSIEEAVFLGDSILVMTKGPGRILGIIENSRRGTGEFRNSKNYFCKCAEIRGIVEEI